MGINLQSLATGVGAVAITESEFEALSEIKDNTLYLIVGSDYVDSIGDGGASIPLYKSSQVIVSDSGTGSTVNVSEIREGEKLIWCSSYAPADYLPDEYSDYTHVTTGKHYYNGYTYEHGNGLWFYKDDPDSHLTKYFNISDEVEHFFDWCNVSAGIDGINNITEYLKYGETVPVSRYLDECQAKGTTTTHFFDYSGNVFASDVDISEDFPVPFPTDMNGGIGYSVSLRAVTVPALSYSLDHAGGTGEFNYITIDNYTDTGDSVGQFKVHLNKSSYSLDSTRLGSFVITGDEFGIFDDLQTPTKSGLVFNGYHAASGVVLDALGRPGNAIKTDLLSGNTTVSINAMAKWVLQGVQPCNGTIAIVYGNTIYAYWNDRWKNLHTAATYYGIDDTSSSTYSGRTRFFISNGYASNRVFVGCTVSNSTTGFTGISFSGCALFDLSNDAEIPSRITGSTFPAGLHCGDIIENGSVLCMCTNDSSNAPQIQRYWNVNYSQGIVLIPPVNSKVTVGSTEFTSSGTGTSSKRCLVHWNGTSVTLYKLENEAVTTASVSKSGDIVITEIT